MTLAHGPQTLAIPGPSIVPERVLRAMHRASPNIYTGALVEMTRSLVPDLKRVARTAQRLAMYIGNGQVVQANNPSSGVSIDDAYASWAMYDYAGSTRLIY